MQNRCGAPARRTGERIGRERDRICTNWEHFAPRAEIRDNGEMFALTTVARSNALAIALAAALALPQIAIAQSAAPAAGLARSAKDAASYAWNGAQDVAIYALGLIGVDYRFGGDTPENGVDCSGLVRYVFQQVTGVTLPRTAKELSRLGNHVASTDLAPGDLVFFNTRRLPFSHVGIYLGDNRFIHAPSTGSEVEIAKLSENYWQKHFSGARRLVGVLPSLVPSAIAAPLPAPEAMPLPPQLLSVAPGPDAARDFWAPLPGADDN
jgi:cell wall-associated NlpC family hydrolase